MVQAPPQAGPGEVSRPRALGRADPLVEAVDLAGAAGHRAAWADLARRALEPDVFLDPLFALPAARRFPPERRPFFVLVWSFDAVGQPVLIGLCPLDRRRGAVARSWTHEQAVSSAPLLDAERAAEALRALLDWLVRSRSCRAGLLCHGVPLDGPLGRLLTGRAVAHATVEMRTRAVLERHTDDARHVRPPKEWRRQHRRLLDRGVVEFRSARDPEAVRRATEDFLRLEAAGWKGRRGTALGQDPALALFTRTLTDGLARDGRCRIDSLNVGGRPVAMGIVLRSRDRAYFWKTAFDETLAALSPGRQFAMELTAAQRKEPGLASTDSCALPDHPMIDRLWPGRMTVADLIIAAPDAPDDLLERAAARLRLRRRWRALVKAAYLAMRSRFRGP